MLDVFYDKAYGKLYEIIDKATCEEFFYLGEHGSIKNIFLKRKVPFEVGDKQFFDIITPYGFGGPVVIDTDNIDELMQEYARAWKKYCAEQNIVAEFVRFHLFDNIDVRERFYGNIAYVSENVVVNTTYPIDDLWMRFEHKVRKNVKKARANGLVMIRDDTGARLDDFLDIYYGAMKRNNATDYYYFDRTYFETINEKLKGHYVYFHTLKDDKVISTELVLCSDKYAYSFLGGTNADYYELRPNDFLKYDIIFWCTGTGRKAFILGGGYHKDDGIYKYKKCFAPDGDVSFYVGKVIHDQAVYDKLVAMRKLARDLDESSSFFPLYRV